MSGPASAPGGYVPPKLQSVKAESPKSVVRGQTPDTPQFRIPTPEELGVSMSRPAAVDEPLDWAAVERKLDAAGATSFQVEKTADGFRFSCQLASGMVTGHGATRAEAVREALAQITR